MTPRKMDDTVTKSDLEKAKNYKTIHNTNYSIIVGAVKLGLLTSYWIID
jgi:hypothetical protein